MPAPPSPPRKERTEVPTTPPASIRSREHPRQSPRGGHGDFPHVPSRERAPEIASGAAASRPAPHASCFPASHASRSRALNTGAAAHPPGASRLPAPSPTPPGGPHPARPALPQRWPRTRVRAGRGSLPEPLPPPVAPGVFPGGKSVSSQRSPLWRCRLSQPGTPRAAGRLPGRRSPGGLADIWEPRPHK